MSSKAPWTSEGCNIFNSSLISLINMIRHSFEDTALKCRLAKRETKMLEVTTERSSGRKDVEERRRERGDERERRRSRSRDKGRRRSRSRSRGHRRQRFIL